jgi:hypothetical protein
MDQEEKRDRMRKQGWEDHELRNHQTVDKKERGRSKRGTSREKLVKKD